ncbi:hypothetical protein [Mangrovimonas futianensis]|uniref:hypothetical protein n=1 Tax=Mangrovimonas futianensis TaxID=2895523 RepID=UPI001E4587F8|nr:hypothetical protein [Mangrovimonas futianensis]MCF1423250.1 hypothetical protein [Mangrovimonas futianensis]
MKKTYIFGLLILITSCGKETDLKNRIEQLQAQNDSLRSELKNYENKYVFENVFFKHYPVNGSEMKKGEKYFGEFVFLPYLENDIVLFGTEIAESGRTIKNPDTLRSKRSKYGAFSFEVDIVNDTTELIFMPLMKDDISIKHQNLGYDGVLISDKIRSK